MCCSELGSDNIFAIRLIGFGFVFLARDLKPALKELHFGEVESMLTLARE